MTAPIYLHFLDRELGESVGTTVTPHDALRTIEILLLASTAQFYAGLSLVWEHPSVDGQLQTLLASLMGSGQLGLLSHHRHLDEFVDSHQRLYRHDRDRYPAYFEDKVLPFGPTDSKEGSTTDSLVRSFEGLTDNPTSMLEPEAVSAVNTAMNRRCGEAITFALFEAELGAAAPAIRRNVATTISTLFTEHYRDSGNGDIPTGVRGLAYFDRLSNGFPAADTLVAGRVLSHLGLSALVERKLPESDEVWEHLSWDHQYRESIARPVAAIIRCAASVSQVTEPSLAARSSLIATVDGWFADLAQPAPRASGGIHAIAMALGSATSLLEAIVSRDPWLKSVAYPNLADNTLVVTATDSEAEALHSAVQAAGKTVCHRGGPGVMSHYEIKPWPTTNVRWVRCRPGGGTLGGSQDVVSHAISEFSPNRVIMVGIAFGVNEHTQPIGTVLVGDRVANYDQIRFGTDPTGGKGSQIEDRSDVGHANIDLVEVFRDQALAHREKTEVGLLLSGPELVDNLARRDELVARHPGAVGGEMEGYGVYVACHRKSVPWVLVKAVCDWGDGKKGTDKADRQRVAAVSAAKRLLAYLAP